MEQQKESKRDRHNTNGIKRTGFFCHSFTCEWRHKCWMKRSKPDRLALQDLSQRLLCFTITFYFCLHCLEIFWVCFYCDWYKMFYQQQEMKGQKQPGIHNTPFVSNSKAVFPLSLLSSAEAQGLAQCPGPRNRVIKGFGRQSSPRPVCKKSSPKVWCSGLSPLVPDPSGSVPHLPVFLTCRALYLSYHLFFPQLASRVLGEGTFPDSRRVELSAPSQGPLAQVNWAFCSLAAPSGR